MRDKSFKVNTKSARVIPLGREYIRERRRAILDKKVRFNQNSLEAAK
jgi:hypothetical protein